MFKLKKAQKICQIGNFQVGGQFGQNPPLLIASLFHNGDKLLEDRKAGQFDQDKAREYVKTQENLSRQTGIPAMVAMVANSAAEASGYIDWFTSISDQPFGIDMWLEKARLETAEYVAKRGLQDKFLYNSITPWDKDLPGQVKRLKELGIQNIVLMVYDEADPTPQGRLTCFNRMLEVIGPDTFQTILVDTAVMNLPAIAFSGEANRLIKEASGLPCGLAAANGTYMWKEARESFGREGFAAMNAAMQACSVLLWSDFIFYGPLVMAPRVFPAVAAGSAIAATLGYQETAQLPDKADHPLYKFFGDFAIKLQQEK